MATITDRVPRIQFLLGNRTDIDDQIIQWAGDAYLELGSSIPFDELEETEEDQFVVDQSDYEYPDNARAVKALTAFINDAPYPLMKKDIRVVSRYMTSTPGVPAIWAPYNSVIIVRPVPQDTYDFEWRYWIKPVLETDIEDTELLLPEDWLEVVDYMAAYRGFISLGEAEKAQSTGVLLHGDPRQGGRIGLIKAKLLRKAAESEVSDFAFVPRVRPYGWV